MITTGECSRMRAYTSKPVMSGSRRSSSTRSGREASNAAIRVLARVRTRHGVIAVALEERRERVRDRPLVVDDEDRRHQRAPCASTARVSSSNVNGFITLARPVCLDELLRRVALHVAGEEDDARCMRRIALDELAIDRIATRVRHAQVQQQRIVASTLEQRVRLRAGAGRVHRMTEPREVPHDGGANRRLVVDDEHRSARDSPDVRHLRLDRHVDGSAPGGTMIGKLDDERRADCQPTRRESSRHARERCRQRRRDRDRCPCRSPFVV